MRNFFPSAAENVSKMYEIIIELLKKTRISTLEIINI